MFSVRFNRPVAMTRHARQRMQERNISDDLLLQIIETGQTRYSDDVRLWVWLEVPTAATTCCVPHWFWSKR